MTPDRFHLLAAAQAWDDEISHPTRLGLPAAYAGIGRSASQPPSLHTPANIISLGKKQGWYLTHEELLAQGPASFTTLDGQQVTRDAVHGYRNPNAPTGATGPGVLGVGSNIIGQPIPESRAVDVLLQIYEPRTGALRLLVGARGDTGERCLIGGFTSGDAFANAVRELIEETLTASARRLHQLPTSLSEEDVAKQLKTLDPQLYTNLTALLRNHCQICYQGPVRADPRNTDARWIATTLYSGVVTPDQLQAALTTNLGTYQLQADRELQQVGLVAPVVDNAWYASHGPLMLRALNDVWQEQLSARDDKAAAELHALFHQLQADVADLIAQPKRPNKIMSPAVDGSALSAPPHPSE